MPSLPSVAVTIGRSLDCPSTISWTGAVTTSDMVFLSCDSRGDGDVPRRPVVGDCAWWACWACACVPSLAWIDGTRANRSVTNPRRDVGAAVTTITPGRAQAPDEAGRGLGDALVRRRQRHPHVLRVAVERAGRDEDPEPGQVRDRGPAVLAAGLRAHPQVQAGVRAVDRVARALERRAQHPAPAPVDAPAASATCSSSASAAVVAACTGPGTIMPGVLAHLEQPRDERRVARDERRAVAREVGLLGQRVHREQAREVAAGHPRVEDARHARSTPTARPTPARRSTRRTRPRRAAPTRAPRRRPRAAGRRRAPSRRGCPGSSARPAGRRRRPRQARRRVVGRLAASHPPAARPRRTSGRPPTGAAPRRPRRGRAATAGTRRAPWSRPSAAPPPGRARGRRAGGRTSRRRPAAARACRASSGSPASPPPPPAPPARRSGVGSTGVPTDRSTMPPGYARARSANGVERVPGEVRQGAGQQAHRARRQSPCTRSGSVAMIGWSLSISPIFAAPPGEPRSSKNSTFAL